MARAARTVLEMLKRAFRGLRYVWVMTGAALLMLFALEACYRSQSALRYSLWSSTAGRSAAHPYSGLPWYADFLEEERAAGSTRWRPYVYHRRAPFPGRYVAVDSTGLRRTVQAGPAAGDTVHIFLFGGSTMFGVSQRDSNTIASVLARRLAERRDPDVTYRVTNFGQSGYVFTQEVIELELQLREGARPDVVVFYDGLNDVSAAVQNRTAGLPQNEANRARDFELGRTIYSLEGSDFRAFGKLLESAVHRLRIFQRLNIALAKARAGDEARSGLAEDVASSYASTARMVEALAQAYQFRALYVWQPGLYYPRKPLTPYEVHLTDQLKAAPFNVEQRALHEVLPGLVATAMKDVAPGRVVDLSEVFRLDSLPAYTDAVGHNTERAVPFIVDGFAPAVVRLVDRGVGSGGPRDPRASAAATTWDR